MILLIRTECNEVAYLLHGHTKLWYDDRKNNEQKGTETFPIKLPHPCQKKHENFERLLTIVLMRSNNVFSLERWIDWRWWWIGCRVNHRNTSYSWRILRHSLCGCQMIIGSMILAAAAMFLDLWYRSAGVEIRKAILVSWYSSTAFVVPVYYH